MSDDQGIPMGSALQQRMNEAAKKNLEYAMKAKENKDTKEKYHRRMEALGLVGPEFTEFTKVPKETVETNPKKSQGALKAPIGYAPTTAILEMEAVMAGGAHKYGAYNFRDSPIDAMTYIGAIGRHLALFTDGVDIDKESGRLHLAHIMACCAVAIDAQYTKMFVDNRSKTGLVEGILEDCARTHNGYTEKHDANV